VLTLLFLPALYAAWFRVPRAGAAEAPQEAPQAPPPAPGKPARAAADDDLEDLRPAE